MKITLQCDTAPATKKNSPQIFGRGRGARAIVLPSAPYLAWFKDILQDKATLKAALGDLIPFTVPVSISAAIYRKKNVGDFTGFTDAIGDALQSDVWQCGRATSRPVTVRTKNSRTGIVVERQGRKSDCKKKFISDERIQICPVCKYQGMNKKRQGLGIITDDRLIAHWDGTRLYVDANNPRIELDIMEFKETDPKAQYDWLFDQDEDEDENTHQGR